jgi:hypothetical protein
VDVRGFNSASYNLEIDDDAWNGRDPAALETAARITAFLCTRTGIPPTWTLQPTHAAGVCRHYDLGGRAAGTPTRRRTCGYGGRSWRRFGMSTTGAASGHPGARVRCTGSTPKRLGENSVCGVYRGGQRWHRTTTHYVKKL